MSQPALELAPPAGLAAAEQSEAAPGRFEGVLRRWGRALLILPPYLWMLIFFLVPFAIVLKLSFSQAALAIPPYLPIWSIVSDAGASLVQIELDLSNYVRLVQDSLYVQSYVNSVRIAAICTVLTLLIGFPMAYAMARAPEGTRNILVMLVILPFWTSFLIRVYAWMGILKNDGLLNGLLLWLGLIGQPLAIINTETAVLIGITYAYLPFMILPLYANLVKHDPTLLEAAVDLGCPPAKTFWVVTVPLALPGILAGCFLVFIPAVGEFVIPDLLGGSNTLMIGRTIWVEFFSNRDWPTASAVAVVLLLILIVPIVLFQRQQARQAEAEKA